MSEFRSVRRVRGILAAGAVARALAWGAATGATVLIAAAAVDALRPVPPGTRTLLGLVSVAAALAVAGTLCWRDRGVWSMDRVALWIEERVPSLEYLLVTALEGRDERFLKGTAADGWPRLARGRALRSVRAPAAALAAAVLVMLLLPAGAVARLRSPHPGDSLERTPLGGDGRAAANRLDPLVAEVVPPAYTGQRATTIDEPATIRAIEGSALTLRGRGAAAGVAARAGADTVAARGRGDRWEIAMRVGRRPLAIRLDDGAHQRIVTLEPIADEVPVVTLVAPAHDSVVRAPTGRVALDAGVHDDFGIANVAFELIVSSGEGETFTFKTGTFGVTRPAPGTRSATVRATLSLDSLALRPGDIVHLRAVARDANTVTGPGVGTSETRAIRVARPDEYDSVAVEGVPPGDPDKSLLSERMLITLVEALQKRRPSLARAALLDESGRIASDQKTLRRAVGDVVYARLGGQPSGEAHSDQDEDAPEKARTMEALLRRADAATNRSADPLDFEGDETPVVAVNQPLLEAYNAMWDAATHLDLAELDQALPFMQRALEAIQRARRAERLYLRGAPPRVVLDLDRVRLTGKDKGTSSTRRVAEPDSGGRVRADRLARLVDLAAADPGAAADSLLVFRIDALSDAPAVAAALGAAATALRRGDGPAASAALAGARRALAGAPVRRDSLARWSSIP